MEEHILSVFENMVLRKIFGPKNEEEEVSWRRLRKKSFITCTLHQTLLGDHDDEDGTGGACSTHERDKNS
jgi:hypothetical protein